MARRSGAGLGGAGQGFVFTFITRRGWAGRGRAWRGAAWLGMAWRGKARICLLIYYEARRGLAWLGSAGQGKD